MWPILQQRKNQYEHNMLLLYYAEYVIDDFQIQANWLVLKALINDP